MNRTQRKQAKKAQARQMAEILEMRDAVRAMAAELYVRTLNVRDPEGHDVIARACIQAAINYHDALQSFVPAPVAPTPEELEIAQAAHDAVDAAREEKLDREGEGRELARDAVAEMLEPGSTEEMEAHS